MSHPFTDIVIPVHNALPYLQHCVDTVCQHTSNYRIIFVDDFSDPDTKSYLQAAIHDHKDWLLVQTGKQKWFTRASNLGLRLVKTQRALLLNSDTEVNSGWLQELHDVWDDVEKQRPGVQIGLVGSIQCNDGPTRYIESHVRNQGYISGHCYLLSMSVLEELARRRGTPGWYFNEQDPGQIHIASDRIMCWDMNNNGFVTIGCYHAAVGHHGGKSWGHNLGAIPLFTKDVD